MKKYLCLVLCLLLTLSLFGCGKEPAETTASTTEPATSQITDTPDDTTADTTAAADSDVPLRLPLLAISMPVIQEDFYSDDDALLFSQIYQDAALIAPDAEAAEQVVLNLLHQIDLGQSYAQEIHNWAEEYYDPDFWFPYSHQQLYAPTRLDEKVLSVYGKEIAFSGGVHPNKIGLSASFDMATGNLLRLEDVLLGSDAATELSQLIIEDLSANREDYQLYDGYASIVNERFGGTSDNWKTQPGWYFSDVGLCIYFSPYDIAPYVSGTILVEIPYSQLQDILRSDYLPAELPAATGTVSVALAQDVDLEQYSQFAEAILNSEGERFVLYSDDLVSNVTLEQGIWSEDGSYFTPVATVFLAHTLCAGDAVIVQDQIPDTLPKLRLTYESKGEIISAYITQSGKDGSMILTDLS